MTLTKTESIRDNESREPTLKYEHYSNDINDLFSNDIISHFAVHSKISVVGSGSGKVYLLDANGNRMFCENLCSMSSKITGVSIDHSGEYIGYCSLDGGISIVGLYSSELNMTVIENEPTFSLSLDPIFYKSGAGRRFMSGTQNFLFLYEKSLFNRYKKTILSENEGPFSVTSWRGRYAAWATNKGVRVFDIVTHTHISLIKAPNETLSFEIPTRIFWTNQTNFLLATGSNLQNCRIVKRNENISSPVLPEYVVEISFCHSVGESWILGVAPLDNGAKIVVLSIEKESSDLNRPSLLIFESFNYNDYYLRSKDVLSLQNWSIVSMKEITLNCLVEDNYLYIISHKDIILGKPRDLDDHIDYLLESSRFEEALLSVKENIKILKRHGIVNIGLQYTDYLISQGEYSKAGSVVIPILGQDKKLWQEIIFKFAEFHQLSSISPMLPTDSTFRLDSHLYEMVLFEFLKSNDEEFLNVIKVWPPTLYNVSAVVNAVMEQLLLYPENENLFISLAILFSHQRKYDKALGIYLKLGHKDVFEFIGTHGLFNSISEHIQTLFDLDPDESIRLCIEGIDQIPPELIVRQLKSSSPKILLNYLEAIKDKESSKKYHGTLVSLIAEFEPSKLLSFLKYSDHYSMNEALEITKSKNLLKERIYLLAVMGYTKDALSLIISELSNIDEAIHFCKKHDDSELWNDLIDSCLDTPHFVKALLDNIGTHVDPRNLIMKIRGGQEIPHLRDSLVRIIHDYRLQVSLAENCKRILVSDCFCLLNRNVKLRNRGISLIKTCICDNCKNPLGSKFIVYRCHHVFHVECQTNFKKQECSSCSSQRRRLV